jgi:hypothetical protein
MSDITRFYIRTVILDAYKNPPRNFREMTSGRIIESDATIRCAATRCGLRRNGRRQRVKDVAFKGSGVELRDFKKRREYDDAGRQRKSKATAEVVVRTNFNRWCWANLTKEARRKFSGQIEDLFAGALRKEFPARRECAS